MQADRPSESDYGSHAAGPILGRASHPPTMFPIGQTETLTPRPRPSVPDLPVELSVVVPCFNEEEVLPELVKRLQALLDRLSNNGKLAADSQVMFVDDGSVDGTWELIRQFNAEDARIGGIELSGNRGHQTRKRPGRPATAARSSRLP